MSSETTLASPSCKIPRSVGRSPSKGVTHPTRRGLSATRSPAPPPRGALRVKTPSDKRHDEGRRAGVARGLALCGLFSRTDELNSPHSQEERYATLAPLARALAQITPARFDHLSQFLRHPAWEATNNGTERAGRAFRHGQGPHFNLRSRGSIEGALKARLQHRRAAASAPPPPVALCSRGRRSYRPREECMAA